MNSQKRLINIHNYTNYLYSKTKFYLSFYYFGVLVVTELDC